MASGSTLALLLIVLSIGAVAAHSDTHLSAAAISPRNAVIGDQIHFTVLYTDRTGAAPRSVSAVIDGVAKAMARTAGTYATGATYSYTTTLPKGHHDVVFTDTDAGGKAEWVGAGSIWVKDGSSGGGGTTGGTIGTGGEPSPTVKLPAPTAVATTKPIDPAPVVTQAPKATAPADDPVDRPDPTMGDVNPGQARQTPRPTDPSAAVVAKATAGPTAEQEVASRTSPPATDAPGVVSNVATVGPRTPGAPAANPRGAVTAAFGDLAFRRSMPLPELLKTLAPSIAASSAGATAWAAFVIFGKRRRDGTPPAPDEVLAAAAATGLEPAVTQTVPVPGVDESMLPRWRRPSLQAARKTDPLRMVAETPHLTFDASPILPVAGLERRQVRYRLVRLLDTPDELYSTEIGLLDQGDEVQLVERHGAYWRVLCPDGRQGWLHRMTLADPVALPDPRAESAASGDTAEIGPDDILDAYLRARHQDGAVD